MQYYCHGNVALPSSLGAGGADGYELVASEQRAAVHGAHVARPSLYLTAALAPVALVVAWHFLTHGSECRRLTFQNAVSYERGLSLGPNTVFAKAGQTLVIDYEIKAMPRGYLTVAVYRRDLLGFPTQEMFEWVRQAQSGQFRYDVPGTGLYDVRLDGSPDGRGYDVTYNAWWHVD